MAIIHSENWSLTGIKGVLIDKDGTLIDSHCYWGRIIVRRAMAISDYYALNPDELPWLSFVMGYDIISGRLRPEGPIALVSRDEVIAVVERNMLQRGITVTRQELSTLFFHEHEAFLSEILDYVKILPGVLSILSKLKNCETKIAVVTTDTIANTTVMLEHLKLNKYIDAIIGKESTDEPKVTGIPALKALRELGVTSCEAVSIGDAPMDLIMAEKSGLKAGIGIASGQLDLEELRNYSQYLSHSLTEIQIKSDI